VISTSSLIRLLKSGPPKDPKSSELDEIIDPRVNKIKRVLLRVFFLSGASIAVFIFGARVFFSPPKDNQSIASAPKAVLSPSPNNQPSSSIEPHQSNVTVKIDPIPDNQVSLSIYKQTGAGRFIIGGTSSGVYSNPKLRIYVLVRPIEPPAPSWYVQRPVTPGKDGAWWSEVWHGGGGLQPQRGDKIQIVAAVAAAIEIEGYKRVDDIRDIAPVDQSNALTISIASLK
jgi:hypothetical protein